MKYLLIIMLLLGMITAGGPAMAEETEYGILGVTDAAECYSSDGKRRAKLCVVSKDGYKTVTLIYGPEGTKQISPTELGWGEEPASPPHPLSIN